MLKFFIGAMFGIAMFSVSALLVWEARGPASVLWVDYGAKETYTYFTNMTQCENAQEVLQGELDSACFRAEVVVKDIPNLVKK